MKKLLELKAKIKKKMPKFTRSDSHKKDKLKGGSWRSPKGLQNKMRLQIRGYKRIVKTGYGTPKDIRGVESDGKIRVVILTLKELKNVNPKTQKIVIGSTVGTRKKLQIIDEAKKQGLVFANYKDAEKYSKNLTDKISKQTKENKDKKQMRAKVQEAAKTSSKKDDKKTVEEKVSDEEKKVAEKKEKDKILIQKEG